VDVRYGNKLKTGALGYALKESAFDELVQAIRVVVANRIYLSPKIADIVIKEYVGLFTKMELSFYSTLIPRGRPALQLLDQGKTTKKIAFRLYVSTKTIETHRQRIMEKLNLYTVAELTKYAIREGLTSLES